MAALTDLRHEKFVRAYVRRQIEGLKDRKSQYLHPGFMWRAYKEAYPHVTKQGCLYAASSRLFKRPEIQQRIQEVTKRLIKRADITEERILSQYDEAYDLAKEHGKTADMVSATTAQAKLVGLLRDRIEAGAPGDFDKMENVSDVLEAVERQVGPQAAMALAGALGLKVENGEAAPESDAAELEALEPPSGAVN